MWAIIGGTGFEHSESIQVIEELDCSTPFGPASSGTKRIKIGKSEALFIPRHGQHHELLPSEINYRANIFAAKLYGASRILSISAVGSLVKDFCPGEMVLPTQYIDRTKSVRAHTFCGAGVVGHVSLAHPVCPANIEFVRQLAGACDFSIHCGATYVCMEGPAFSTQKESLWYRSIDAQIIGMTAYPEYALAREAGLCYCSACFITDFDCWDDSVPHVTLDEIRRVMHDNNGRAYGLAERLLQLTGNFPCSCAEAGLKNGLLTTSEHLPAEAKKWLSVICR